jgi:hypothetical protein
MHQRETHFRVYTVWCSISLTRTATVISRHSRHTDFYYVFIFITTLRQTRPRERPEAAICVRKSSARRVLHFTPLIAASCVLHRPANRVIHRLQLYCIFSFLSEFSFKAQLQVNKVDKHWGITRTCLTTRQVSVIIKPSESIEKTTLSQSLRSPTADTRQYSPRSQWAKCRHNTD